MYVLERECLIRMIEGTALTRTYDKLYSAFIRSQSGNRQIASHGMIGAWSRSSKLLSNSSQMPPAS